MKKLMNYVELKSRDAMENELFVEWTIEELQEEIKERNKDCGDWFALIYEDGEVKYYINLSGEVEEW